MRISEIAPIEWSRRTLGDDVLVWVDAEKIRASWEHDRHFYFDTADHPNAIRGRVERFGEWIKQGIPVQAPEISLSDAGEVIFTNGRHRFLWMLQNGQTHIPVAVPAEHADEVRQRFGQ